MTHSGDTLNPNTQPPACDNPTLSTPAKIGMGLGVAIFVTAMASMVFFFLRRRRRRTRRLSRKVTVTPQPNIHERRRRESPLHENDPRNNHHDREYIWGPAPGTTVVVEVVAPDLVDGTDAAIEGLRPPPSPGRPGV